MNIKLTDLLLSKVYKLSSRSQTGQGFNNITDYIWMIITRLLPVAIFFKDLFTNIDVVENMNMLVMCGVH